MAKTLARRRNETDEAYNLRLAEQHAALGDLEIRDDNVVSHPDLQQNYIINGQMYGLKDILKAVAGDPEGASETAYNTWNELDDAEKLTRIKEYLVSMDAAPAAPGENTGLTTEPPGHTMAERLARIERHLGLDRLE